MRQKAAFMYSRIFDGCHIHWHSQISLSLWSSLFRFHWFESISRWYFACSSIKHSITFNLLMNWVMTFRHRTQSVPFVSTEDIVCCATLQNWCQIKGKPKAHMKQYSCGFVGTAFERIFTFLPFPVFSSPHQTPSWGCDFSKFTNKRI